MSEQDDRRIELLGDVGYGWTAWRYDGPSGGVFTLPPGVLPTFEKSEQPTRKVVQWHVVDSNGQVLWGSPEQGQPVLWELSGSKIVGVRLVEDDE